MTTNGVCHVKLLPLQTDTGKTHNLKRHSSIIYCQRLRIRVLIPVAVTLTWFVYIFLSLINKLRFPYVEWAFPCNVLLQRKLMKTYSSGRLKKWKLKVLETNSGFPFVSQMYPLTICILRGMLLTFDHRNSSVRIKRTN